MREYLPTLKTAPKNVDLRLLRLRWAWLNGAPIFGSWASMWQPTCKSFSLQLVAVFLSHLDVFLPQNSPEACTKKKHTCKEMSVGKTIHQFNKQYHPIQILQKTYPRNLLDGNPWKTIFKLLTSTLPSRKRETCPTNRKAGNSSSTQKCLFW